MALPLSKQSGRLRLQSLKIMEGSHVYREYKLKRSILHSRSMVHERRARPALQKKVRDEASSERQLPLSLEPWQSTLRVFLQHAPHSRYSDQGRSTHDHGKLASPAARKARRHIYHNCDVPTISSPQGGMKLPKSVDPTTRWHPEWDTTCLSVVCIYFLGNFRTHEIICYHSYVHRVGAKCSSTI